MPLYFYQAKSFSGEPKTGTMEAENEMALAKLLRAQGYILVSASTQTQEESIKAHPLNIFQYLGGVSLAEKLMFTKNLKVMVASGLSLPKALRTLGVQARSPKFKKALADISDQLSQGKSFSEAIRAYPNIFPEIFYHMVKVGEESGTLEKSLENLALQMEREHELKSKIKGAMIYPAVIVSVMLLVAFLMLSLVVPKLAEVFADLKIELPATTKFIINLGNFLKENILIIGLMILALILATRIIFSLHIGKIILDKVLITTPVLGELIKKINSSYAMRTLSVLISSGVSFVSSLEIVAGVVPNIYFKEALLQAKEEIKKGGKFSEVLARYSGLFSPTLIQMVTVGEETGETSQILSQLADFYEQEVALATKNAVALIEPLLIVLIALMVGFFAVSMIQPMYSAMSSF